MKKPIFRFQLSSLLIAVSFVAVGLGWYANHLVRQPNFKVMYLGGSLAMSPTITREILAVDVNAYRRAVPARWDIVVLNPREQPGGAYVADALRVLGLPGETISISDGKLIVDGHPLIPPEHLRNIQFHCNLPDVEIAQHPYTVPVGHYYLIGDNPDEAIDSRALGAFPEADIRGRIVNR